MLKGVGYRFPSNAVHLVAHNRVQLTRFAVHHYAEIGRVLLLEFHPNYDKSLGQLIGVSGTDA